MKKKTQYFMVLAYNKRRIWEDEEGWFTVWRGKREYIDDPERYKILIKHENDLKITKTQENER